MKDVRMNSFWDDVPTMTQSEFEEWRKRFLGADGGVVSYETAFSSSEGWRVYVEWVSGMRTMILIVPDFDEILDGQEKSVRGKSKWKKPKKSKAEACRLKPEDVPEGIAFDDPAEVLFDEADLPT